MWTALLALLLASASAFDGNRDEHYENLNYIRPAISKSLTSYSIGHFQSQQTVTTVVDRVSDRARFRFNHGVASGDPTQTAIILWTRLTFLDAATNPSSAFRVRFRVLDSTGRTTILSGNTTTSVSVDYTVKVDVPNLTPARAYTYEFFILDTSNRELVSPRGRFKTLPSGSVSSISFAYTSCSNMPHGYFNAYNRMAVKDALQFVIHLGDYIYEYDDGVLGDGAGIDRVPIPNKELCSLDEYRTRHAQYKSDVDLQALHGAHPMIAVWDDHEFVNNAWKDGPENDTCSWVQRKANAIQAYYEWMPIRQVDPATRSRIYRSFQLGDLAELWMLDTRVEGRTRQKTSANEFSQSIDQHRMISPEQSNWLLGGLTTSKSQWKLIGQQVFFSGLRTSSLFAYGAGDTWDGYVESRNTITKSIKDNKVQNVVVLTGDIHSSWAKHVYHDDDRIAVEFISPSVSSTTPEYFLGSELKAKAVELALSAAEKGLQFVDLRNFGYIQVTLNSTHARASYFFTNGNQRVRSDSEQNAREFYVAAGRPCILDRDQPSECENAAFSTLASSITQMTLILICVIILSLLL